MFNARSRMTIIAVALAWPLPISLPAWAGEAGLAGRDAPQSAAAPAAPSSPAAGPRSDVFTPGHLAMLRMVTSTVISPDGRFVAYTLSVPRRPFVEDNGPPFSELHVVDANGRSRPFVSGEVNVANLAWTPDGGGIAFTAKRGGDKESALYVIPIDGGEARKVVEHATGVGSFAISPDGVEAAFVASEEPPKARKDFKDKGFNAEIYEEDDRPARVWLARLREAGAGNALPGDNDGAERFKPRMLSLEGHATRVVWSPAGGRLAVALSPTPLVDDEYMKSKINIVDVATGRAAARVETPGKIGDFQWSPDGKHLAVLAAEDLHDPSPGRLTVVGADGGSPTDVLPGYLGEVSAAQWQNADTVMFLGDEGVWTGFGKIGVDGANHKVIVPAGQVTLSGLTLSRDGLAGAFILESPFHPGEVAMMRHGEAAPRRLTDSNPWLSDLRLARQEPVRFRARDGLEIEGVLVRPLDEQPGRRYPLIVSVHGGPEAHERMDWLTQYARPGQVAAARGFAVFYPNYRGSTGRGVAFSKLDHGDPAGKEFDDLVDGVDHLVAAGLVDKDKVGVTGGSYGGYASAWCATALSERFAAAVMFVGISDQISKFGTTDIPNEMMLVHERAWPWDNWELFRQRSPLTHFQKCRTPILIMHGRDDTRVHPSQSLTLYRYLKSYGQVPVRLVYYPGEGHGNRKAASRLDYNLRMMQWMEHYLIGPGGDPPAYELDYGPYLPEGFGKETDEDESGEDAEAED